MATHGSNSLELTHLLPQRRRLQRRARPTVLWSIGFFLLGQFAFVLGVNRWIPEYRDPEYGHRLTLLRRRQAERPEQPLLLVLGSSRVGVGLRPDAVALPGMEARQAPLVFNMGMTGAGPIMELCYLRRLLAAGIRPAHLVLEIHPALLCQQGDYREEGWLNIARLGWEDLPIWCPRVYWPGRMYRNLARANLAPFYTQRFCILSNIAPALMSWKDRQDVWRDLDPWGWLPYPKPTVSPADRKKGLEFAHTTYLAAFFNFVITPIGDEALRETLELARQHGIPTMLLLMPESSEFRAFYPPAAEPALAAYVRSLCADHGVTVADARTWIPDHLFVDGHHLLKDGATVFTQRFAHEVLPSFLGLSASQEYDRTPGRIDSRTRMVIPESRHADSRLDAR